MERSRLGIEPRVLLDGQLTPMRALSVERSAGGSRLDYATVEWDGGHPRAFGDPLRDFALGSQLDGRVCEVVLPLASGNKVIHRGKLKSVRARLDDRGPVLGYTSRLEPYHFGEPTTGMLIRNRSAGENSEVVNVPEQLVFNPMVDGECIGNRSQTMETHPHRHYLFLDWRQSQTEAARTWNQQGPLQNADVRSADLADVTLRPQGEQWTVGEAVLYACAVLNRRQEHVLNCTSVLELESQQYRRVLRDVRIPLGLHLPQVLDMLLEPFGFSWYLEYGAPGQKPRIELFPLGLGAPFAAKMQRPPAIIDPNQTNIERFDLRYDVGRRLINRLAVLGAYVEIEATWDLIRAWPAEFDDVDDFDLAKFSEVYQGNPAMQRAHRDWVLGEDGSYVGLRPEYTAPPDLNAIVQGAVAGGAFEQAATAFGGAAIAPALAIGESQPFAKLFYALRKRFLPCLAINEDGSPAGEFNGVRVDISLDGETWEEQDEITPERFGNIVLLTREAGIRFDDEMIPFELYDHRGTVRVRVTATLRADVRLSGIAGATVSPNADAVPHVLDWPTGFALRLIHPSSPYYSEVRNGSRASAEVDDRRRIDDFAQQLLDAWNQADCDGPITLPGLDQPCEISQVVPKIAGREIDLAVGEGGRSPQIVGIAYDCRGQATTVQLTSYRDTPSL